MKICGHSTYMIFIQTFFLKYTDCIMKVLMKYANCITKICNSMKEVFAFYS